MNKKALGIASAAALVMGVLFAPAAAATPSELAPCSVDSLTKAKGIKSLHAEVRRASTSEVLFSRKAETPARTASVMKVITSVVALDALGPNHQVETKVYADTSSGRVFLVGAGDVTLSRTPGNIVSYYSGGPKLDSLSKQIASWAKRNKFTVSEVVLDSSLYGSAEDWHPTWDKRGLSQGYMAPVSALQIDAGRLTSSRNPNVFIGQRTAKPINQAGVLFLQSLRKYGLALSASASVGKLSSNSAAIASVKSQPISKWIQNTLNVSDNALAEALGRLSSIALGFDGSATSLTKAYSKALKARGIDTKGLLIVDGSGLSRLNKVPAKLVNDVLAQVYGNEASHSAVIAGMPVSGKPGSLRYRFNSGEQRPALFNIEAKTGWIRTGYSLAGKIKAQDGTDLIFTVYNLWTSVSYENRAAMDKLVYGFYRCGSALTNN